MPLNGHVSLVYGISVDSQSIRKSTYSTGEEGVEKEILSQFLLPSVTLCYHIRRCLKQYIGLWLSLVERSVRDREVVRSNRINPTIVYSSHRVCGGFFCCLVGRVGRVRRWADGLNGRALCRATLQRVVAYVARCRSVININNAPTGLQTKRNASGNKGNAACIMAQ